LTQLELQALRPCYAPARRGNSSPQEEFGLWTSGERCVRFQRSDCWSAGTSSFQAPLRARIKAGGGDGRAGGRQTQMVEDRPHRPGLREVREHDAAAAAGTGEHVVAEDAPEQLGPRNA